MLRASEGMSGSNGGLDGLAPANGSDAKAPAATATRTAAAGSARGAATPNGQLNPSPLEPQPANGSSHRVAAVETPGLPLDALSFEV